ncbi:hypothetical protein EDB84DRAFT_1568033 [Lactarius hengduanensis]|nr:hypothetical protein EDB84DRAFT_1568033 [Lactarius hengduanensis]
MLVNNSDGGGPSSNLAEDNHIVPENPSQSNERNEDMSTGHDSDLDLPPGITVPDGLSDSDNSSNDGDVVELSDLQRFASALQEAWRQAIQLEKEKANGKRKMPKTYRGNSKKTLDRREKDHKALASHRFLNIASFMALKKKENELESWGDIEDDELADCPTDRTQRGHASVGIDNTTVGHHSPVPSPQDQAQSERVDEADEHTFSEEEESSDGETPSFLGHARRRITDSDDDDCVTGSLGKDTGPRVVGRDRGKGRVGHWAAEEEEESSDESSKLVGVARYREADNEDSRHGDNDPRPAGSIEAENDGDNNPDPVESEGPGADNDSDSAEEGWGLRHAPPAPSLTPSALSRRSSIDLDFESEDEGVLATSETTDKVLSLWNDRAALSRALTTLAAKSRDSRLDLVLRSRLTGMVRVLNLYQDLTLQYTWRNASAMVTKIQGHGVKRARRLREWILAFVRSGELPEHHYGQSRWNVLDDEDVSQTLQSLLLSHTKGRYITASDVVEIVSGAAMQEKFSRSGISRSSISDRTARRWLQRLSWHYGPMRNGMYLDGHEREDVVAYRNGFVARWKEYEKRFHTWDNDGNEHRPQDTFWVESTHGRFWLILVTHNESIFYQNDSRKTHWIADIKKAGPLPKGDGQSIMVSDFLTSEWGRLCDGKEEARVIFKPGANRDGYFDADNVLKQVDDAIDIFEGKTKGFSQGLFLFDNAPSHQKRAANALSARNMPKGPKANWAHIKDGPRMCHGKNPLTGEPQSFYFSDDHPTMPGWFKGMEQIL